MGTVFSCSNLQTMHRPRPLLGILEIQLSMVEEIRGALLLLDSFLVDTLRCVVFWISGELPGISQAGLGDAGCLLPVEGSPDPDERPWVLDDLLRRPGVLAGLPQHCRPHPPPSQSAGCACWEQGDGG